MAEDTPGIRNKKLLLVAILLGVLVVLLYNWHVNRVRRQAEGEKVTVLCYAKPYRPGDTIRRGELKPIQVDKDLVQLLGQQLADPNDEQVFIGKRIKDRVEKGWLVQWSQVMGGTQENPLPPKGSLQFPLQIDSKRALGDLLQPGDLVRVVAMLPDKNGRIQALTVLDGVKIISIGQRSRSELSDTGTYEPSAARYYRQVVLEIPDALDRPLANVLSHSNGEVWVEKVNPESYGSRPLRIAEDVAHLKDAAPSN